MQANVDASGLTSSVEGDIPASEGDITFNGNAIGLTISVEGDIPASEGDIPYNGDASNLASSLASSVEGDLPASRVDPVVGILTQKDAFASIDAASPDEEDLPAPGGNIPSNVDASSLVSPSASSSQADIPTPGE